jgi:LacI family transcriptional regulator
MAHHFVTIKDLAKILNVSVSTVSRALRDTYDVSQETKEKVVALAQQMKYKPNLNATGLAKRSTHNIGVILPYITNYFFSTVITGIQEVAYSRDFNVTLFLTNDSPEREASIAQNLFVSGLDGLLVSVSSNSNSCDHFQELMNSGLPLVFFDRVTPEINTSKVIQDNYNGAFDAVEHLISNGYKKEWIIYSSFTQESGEKDIYELWKLKEKPDAIFAVNDRKAVGAMLALKNMNIKIGREVGVIGFANDPIGTVISPTLSTIAVPSFDIGRISCELLLKHIKKSNFHPQEITLPGQLIVRQSSIR